MSENLENDILKAAQDANRKTPDVNNKENSKLSTTSNMFGNPRTLQHSLDDRNSYQSSDIGNPRYLNENTENTIKQNDSPNNE